MSYSNCNPRILVRVLKVVVKKPRLESVVIEFEEGDDMI